MKEELIKAYLKAEGLEQKAKKEKKALESEIIALYQDEIPKDKKSKTFDEEKVKVTVKKQDEILSLIEKEYLKIRDSIESKLRPEKVKFSLDIEGYNWIKENNPELYKVVSQCVELKPTPASLKIVKK